MLKRKTIFCILITISISICAFHAHAQSARETDISSVKSTFTYGNNKDYAGQSTDLKADLYKPNLFSVKLPLIILYHGGGYASGDKNLAVMKYFAENFATANISAVVPDFRQGWYESSTKSLCESVTPEKFEDAAHRAYQDERALIRYCKANANALGIDSNKIFLFGISSGGFLVLHQLYLNDAAVDADRITRLGSLDFQSNNLRNSADVAGIISVVGGFYKKDASIVKSYPTLLFNNSCDGAVDFYNGWLGNCSNTIRSYGPGIFTKTMEQYNSPYSLHVFCGFNHGFNTLTYPEGGDAEAIQYVIDKSADFIKEITQSTHVYGTHIASDSIASVPLGDCANFETLYWCKKDSIKIGNDFISLTPNPVSCLLQPKLNIRHPQDETLYLEVIDESGKIISRQKTEYKTSQNVIYLNVTDFTMGINFLLVKNSSGKVLYKTKVMRYCEY